MVERAHIYVRFSAKWVLLRSTGSYQAISTIPWIFFSSVQHSPSRSRGIASYEKAFKPGCTYTTFTYLFSVYIYMPRENLLLPEPEPRLFVRIPQDTPGRECNNGNVTRLIVVKTLVQHRTYLSLVQHGISRSRFFFPFVAPSTDTALSLVSWITRLRAKAP